MEKKFRFSKCTSRALKSAASLAFRSCYEVYRARDLTHEGKIKSLKSKGSDSMFFPFDNIDS